MQGLNNSSFDTEEQKSEGSGDRMEVNRLTIALNNERQARVEAEQSRVAAEQSRVAAEQSRVEAEQSRVEAEQRLALLEERQARLSYAICNVCHLCNII